MSRKPNVNFRDPDAGVVSDSLPDWVPSVIVFGVGLVLFAVIEILIHA